jgi:hypothetical protein
VLFGRFTLLFCVLAVVGLELRKFTFANEASSLVIVQLYPSIRQDLVSENNFYPLWFKSTNLITPSEVSYISSNLP